MKKQTHKDRMDEHLGEKHPGKHKESMDDLLKITRAIDAIIQFPGSEDLVIVDYKTSKDRRHEMMGMMKKEKAKKMAKKK